MTYEVICRYVFANEKVPWKFHDSKVRDRELVYARQISIYLGHSTYPIMSYAELASIFKKDNCTSGHSIKNIKNLMFSDHRMRDKILKYTSAISEHVNRRKEIEMKRLMKVKDAETLNSLLKVIDKMELIAKIYCEITNSKLIKVE